MKNPSPDIDAKAGTTVSGERLQLLSEALAEYNKHKHICAATQDFRWGIQNRFVFAACSIQFEQLKTTFLNCLREYKMEAGRLSATGVAVEGLEEGEDPAKVADQEIADAMARCNLGWAELGGAEWQKSSTQVYATSVRYNKEYERMLMGNTTKLTVLKSDCEGLEPEQTRIFKKTKMVNPATGRKEDAWVVPLTDQGIRCLLNFCHTPSVRLEVSRLWSRDIEKSNLEGLLLDMVEAKTRHAHLCGFKNYTEYASAGFSVSTAKDRAKLGQDITAEAKPYLKKIGTQMKHVQETQLGLPARTSPLLISDRLYYRGLQSGEMDALRFALHYPMDSVVDQAMQKLGKAFDVKLERITSRKAICDVHTRTGAARSVATSHCRVRKGSRSHVVISM